MKFILLLPFFTSILFSGNILAQSKSLKKASEYFQETKYLETNTQLQEFEVDYVKSRLKSQDKSQEIDADLYQDLAFYTLLKSQLFFSVNEYKNIDSAYHFILKSERQLLQFKSLELKKYEKSCEKYNLCVEKIQSLKKEIDNELYVAYTNEKSITKIDVFLLNYASSSNFASATLLKENILIDAAIAGKKLVEIEKLLKIYPSSVRKNELESTKESLLFEEALNQNTEIGFIDFLSKYPNSKYKHIVDQKILEIKIQNIDKIVALIDNEDFDNLLYRYDVSDEEKFSSVNAEIGIPYIYPIEDICTRFACVDGNNLVKIVDGVIKADEYVQVKMYLNKETLKIIYAEKIIRLFQYESKNTGSTISHTMSKMWFVNDKIVNFSFTQVNRNETQEDLTAQSAMPNSTEWIAYCNSKRTEAIKRINEIRKHTDPSNEEFQGHVTYHPNSGFIKVNPDYTFETSKNGYGIKVEIENNAEEEGYVNGAAKITLTKNLVQQTFFVSGINLGIEKSEFKNGYKSMTEFEFRTFEEEETVLGFSDYNFDGLSDFGIRNSDDEAFSADGSYIRFLFNNGIGKFEYAYNLNQEIYPELSVYFDDESKKVSSEFYLASEGGGNHSVNYIWDNGILRKIEENQCYFEDENVFISDKKTLQKGKWQLLRKKVKNCEG